MLFVIRMLRIGWRVLAKRDYARSPYAPSTLVTITSIFMWSVGVTCYNFTSNQFSGFHRHRPCAILEHQTELHPRQLMTDSAGYSDIVFGLFLPPRVSSSVLT